MASPQSDWNGSVIEKRLGTRCGSRYVTVTARDFGPPSSFTFDGIALLMQARFNKNKKFAR